MEVSFVAEADAAFVDGVEGLLHLHIEVGVLDCPWVPNRLVRDYHASFAWFLDRSWADVGLVDPWQPF